MPTTAPVHPEPRGTQRGRPRRCWPLAVTGLALLVASVLMMTAGAQSSRAQTARQHLAPSRLAPLRLPAPAGRYQVGTVALHLIDRSRPSPWVALQSRLRAGGTGQFRHRSGGELSMRSR